jgi:hypothetical protein
MPAINTETVTTEIKAMIMVETSPEFGEGLLGAAPLNVIEI